MLSRFAALSSISLSLKASQDPRIFHRGTPNRGDHSTPNLLLTYRSKASPSPIRGFFGRQLEPEEIEM